MGNIRKKLSEQLTNETKIIIFNVLVDGLSYSDSEKENLIKEYASQFKQDDENKVEAEKTSNQGIKYTAKSRHALCHPLYQSDDVN